MFETRIGASRVRSIHNDCVAVDHVEGRAFWRSTPRDPGALEQMPLRLEADRRHCHPVSAVSVMQSVRPGV